MRNLLLLSPLIIYGILSITELIITSSKNSKLNLKNLEKDNLIFARYGSSIFILYIIIHNLLKNGITIDFYFYSFLFIILISILSISYIKNYHNKHVYTIKIAEEMKSTIDVLTELNEQNNNFEIRIRDFGMPILIIKKENLDDEESILNLVDNIPIIYTSTLESKDVQNNE